MIDKRDVHGADGKRQRIIREFEDVMRRYGIIEQDENGFTAVSRGGPRYRIEVREIPRPVLSAGCPFCGTINRIREGSLQAETYCRHFLGTDRERGIMEFFEGPRNERLPYERNSGDA